MARRNRRRPGSTQPNAPKAADTVKDKRAVIYARVSSTEQHVEGFSVDAQLELLREYATTEKIEVIQEFVDVETAKKAGRIGFTAMLELLAKEGVDTILCEKTDRLYRNITDWVTLDRLKLEIHLVKENLVLSEDSRSHEKFIHGIKVLMAKNYIDNLSPLPRPRARQVPQPERHPEARARLPSTAAHARRPDGAGVRGAARHADRRCHHHRRSQGSPDGARRGTPEDVADGVQRPALGQAAHRHLR